MATAVPDDLIDVPDDLVDVPAADGQRAPAPAQPGVPRAIGAPAAPPAAPAAPPRTLLDQVRGLREAATELVSMALGGGLGLAGGAIGGVAGAMKQGDIGTLQGARRVQDTAMASAERGTGVVRDFLRGSDGRGQPVSPVGQEYIEGVTGVMQNAPALMAAPRGTVGMSPQQPLGIKPALQATGDAARAAGSRAVDAVVPEMTPRSVARVQMASDAGIPIAPHQLATSSVAKAAGKAAGEVPFSGGATLRKAQREGVSRGLVKAIDPEATAGVLDDATFAKLQDAAGERIGEIAARTDVPVETFGDLTTITRRDTPDVQGVISTYATDLAKIASDNGGVVPGTVLRKLRTEAQTQARAARANKGDLARALDDFVKRVDEAVTEHAPEVDVAGLLEARRQYAVSKSLEPLVAKYSDGNIPPQALKAALTGTKEGKRRMARGKAGELGEYANLGSEILAEQSVSTIPERNLVYRAMGDVAAAGKLALVYPFALAYNKLGPRAVKWLADRQARAAAPVPDAPPPGLELAPEGPLPPRPAGEAPASPLGDLTPDWETAPGAAPAAQAIEAVPAEGLVPAVDDMGGPARVRPAGAAVEQPPPRGAGMEIPAVPGRPDLPETMVAGPPAELAPTEAVGAAMQEPATALARRQQEAARLAAETQSPEVQKVLAEHARKLERQAAAEAAKQKRLQDAAELRRVAAQTADPEIQQALHARAVTLEAAEPVPAGKVKEGTPAAKVAPAKADKPVPAGEVTEIAAEVVEPAAATAPAAAPVEPAPRRTEPRVGKAGPKDKFVVGRVYRDSQGNMAIRQADGSWKDIGGSKPPPAPPPPAPPPPAPPPPAPPPPAPPPPAPPPPAPASVPKGTNPVYDTPMKYREAEAAAKRLTEETGKKHQAVNREHVDTEGFTVSEWFVEPADGAPPIPKGMTLEEAKVYQEQANRDRPFGLSRAMIEKKQGGKLK